MYWIAYQVPKIWLLKILIPVKQIYTREKAVKKKNKLLQKQKQTIGKTKN